MSFKERLERLHDSRRRQKERAEEETGEGGDGRDKSVFFAEEVDERAENDGPGKLKVSRETPSHVSDASSNSSERDERSDGLSGGEATAEPERGEVYETLERTYSMRNKSRSKRASRSDDSAARQSCKNSQKGRETDLGRWVSHLRREARRAIDEDNWDEAAPKLFEIVALVPNHPFALEKLAHYHERRGESAAASRYRERLERQSPFGD